MCGDCTCCAQALSVNAARCTDPLKTSVTEGIWAGILQLPSIDRISAMPSEPPPLPPTPVNYAVWFEFHAGRNAGLRRVLSVALSNRRAIDSYMMAELRTCVFNLD